MTNNLSQLPIDTDANAARMKREIADIHRVGLRVVGFHPRSWTCELNYAPGVTQKCRHDNWRIGDDGRVRPAPNTRLSASSYEGEPRLKIHNVPGAGPVPAGPSLPPPAVDESLPARLARIESKLDRLCTTLGS